MPRYKVEVVFDGARAGKYMFEGNLKISVLARNVEEAFESAREFVADWEGVRWAEAANAEEVEE